VDKILIGKGDQPVYLLAKYGNRHGLVAGATGTGKTISLLVPAEGFSRLGVPLFMADVKGDVAGMAAAGTASETIRQRVSLIGIEGFSHEANPVLFWDLYGKAGHPVRTTISEIGPSLLGRILELNDIAQLGVGEALVSTLGEKGVPMPVERTLICPARCRMGAVTPEERAAVRARSPLGVKYESRVNRESAYEILSRRTVTAGASVPQSNRSEPEQQSEIGGPLRDLLWGTKRRQGMVETMAKQAARTVGSQIGRQILRGVLGGILGGSRRR